MRLALEKLAEYMARGPVGQVVGLVDEEEPVTGGIEEAAEPYHRVKQIVVIPDDHVAPLAQVQLQLKRADREFPARLGQHGPVKTAAAAVQKGREGRFEAVVVAVGVGAELRQTGGAALGVLAQTGFLLGRQGHAAQGQLRGRGPQPGKGVLGSGLGGVAGREVKELFAVALAHGFQGREEGAHGLANAGGSLAEEPGPAFAARLAGPVDFPSKSPLPGPVRFKGEAQGVQTAARRVSQSSWRRAQGATCRSRPSKNASSSSCVKCRGNRTISSVSIW